MRLSLPTARKSPSGLCRSSSARFHRPQYGVPGGTTRLNPTSGVDSPRTGRITGFIALKSSSKVYKTIGSHYRRGWIRTGGQPKGSRPFDATSGRQSHQKTSVEVRHAITVSLTVSQLREVPLEVFVWIFNIIMWCGKQFAYLSSMKTLGRYSSVAANETSAQSLGAGD